MGCVGIIFYSPSSHRVSLTHADLRTDLSFLQQEHTWVGTDSQVFLIKNRGEYYLPIQTLLQLLGIGDIQVLESTEGTVVFNHTKNKPQIFKMSEFIDLTTPGAIPRPDNKLYTLKYHPTFSAANMFLVQKRVYERQLNAAASLLASHMPLLVHHEAGWLQTTYTLAEDVLPRIGSDSITDRTSIDYVWPRYQFLLRALKEIQKEGPVKTLAQPSS